MKNSYQCPICNTALVEFTRYPSYICENCERKVTDKAGRLLSFYEESIVGGLCAHYVDTREKYESKICYVGDIKCRAASARFGGVVIQVINDK